MSFLTPWRDWPTERDAQPAAERHEQLIERVAQRLVELRLGMPAVFVLEATLPLSFVASQAMIVFEPIIQSVFNIADYREFQQMMEDRSNIERLMTRIEQLEEQRGARGKSDSEERQPQSGNV